MLRLNLADAQPELVKSQLSASGPTSARKLAAADN